MSSVSADKCFKHAPSNHSANQETFSSAAEFRRSRSEGGMLSHLGNMLPSLPPQSISAITPAQTLEPSIESFFKDAQVNKVKTLQRMQAKADVMAQLKERLVKNHKKPNDESTKTIFRYPSKDRSLKAGIMHIGCRSSFARGGFFPQLDQYATHLDEHIKKSAEKSKVNSASRVILLEPRPGHDNEKKVFEINENGGLYVLKQLGYGNQKTVNKIMDVVLGAIHINADSEKFIAVAASKQLRTVTISIGASNYDANVGDALVKTAVARWKAEKSRNEKAGTRSISIVALENDENSSQLPKQVFNDALKNFDPAFKRWAEKNVSFHSSMIDCVSTWKNEVIGTLSHVKAEGFQKMILGLKPKEGNGGITDLGRPFPTLEATSQSHAGISEINESLLPMEREKKAAIVNLRHVLDASLGSPLGMTTVDEVENDPKMSKLIGDIYRHLIIPSLIARDAAPDGNPSDLHHYVSSTAIRFQNKEMGDELSRVGRNSTNKIFNLCGRGAMEYASNQNKLGNRVATTYAAIVIALHAWYLHNGNVKTGSVASGKAANGKAYSVQEEFLTEEQAANYGAGKISLNDLVNQKGKNSDGLGVEKFTDGLSLGLGMFSETAKIRNILDGADPLNNLLRYTDKMVAENPPPSSPTTPSRLSSYSFTKDKSDLQ